MNVIGISGLHGSVGFKRRHTPGIGDQEKGIVFGLDAAAALVSPEGIVAAAAEERFTGEKATGHFPANAIRYCLAAGGLRPKDVDHIAHGWSFEPHRSVFEAMGDYELEQFREVLSRDAQLGWIRQFLGFPGWEEKFTQVPHHLAHAASTFYPSGYDEALILVADGMGELHSTSILVGHGEQLKIVKQVPALHSFGILYGVFTLYLGFEFGYDEYKVMGLAPYGDSKRYRDKIADLVQFDDKGGFRMPVLYKNRDQAERETYRGTIRELTELLGPPRTPDEEISQRHRDVAAGLQYVLQEGLLRMLRTFQKETDSRRLCMAGGVALNCTANGAIRRSGLFDEIFIQPAAGDDGTALGAALYVQHQKNPPRARKRMGLPLLGPQFDETSIRESLEAVDAVECVRYERFEDLAREVATRISTGAIVGWFQARMEFGPRALGSRSILADPRDPSMREKINRLVKKREAFRPFAPAVTAEGAKEYFEIEDAGEQPYSSMLMVAYVRQQYRQQLPSTTHVDGTARIQVVDKRLNERFWTLLDEFGRQTGIPVLLNTSFNVKGQPIVLSPAEAIETFLRARLDVLVIHNWVVTARALASAGKTSSVEAVE